MDRPLIGIITGTGAPDLDQLGIGFEEIWESTPYGNIYYQRFILGDQPIIHIARHCSTQPMRERRWLLPSFIEARANLIAMAKHGVQRIYSTTAVGAIACDLPIGTIVLPNQLRTPDFGAMTFAIETSGPEFHQSAARPICCAPHGAFAKALHARDLPNIVNGTLRIIRGPRFETFGDVEVFRREGITIAGMLTALPEAFLALELGLCYTMAGIVTDSPDDHPDQTKIAAVATERVKTLLDIFATVEIQPPPCPCNVKPVPGLRERFGIS